MFFFDANPFSRLHIKSVPSNFACARLIRSIPRSSGNSASTLGAVGRLHSAGPADRPDSDSSSQSGGGGAGFGEFGEFGMGMMMDGLGPEASGSEYSFTGEGDGLGGGYGDAGFDGFGFGDDPDFFGEEQEAEQDT